MTVAIIDMVGPEYRQQEIKQDKKTLQGSKRVGQKNEAYAMAQLRCEPIAAPGSGETVFIPAARDLRIGWPWMRRENLSG